MRDFFINALDKLIAVILALSAIGVVVGAVSAASQGGGFLAFIGVLIVGVLYLILTGGMMYLFLGIYHNTKATAEALKNRQ